MDKKKATVADFIANRKKKARMSRKLTPKRRGFARDIVKGATASEAYLNNFDVSPETKLSTIHQEASRTASLPAVQAEIERLFARNGIEMTDVLTIHKRNMMQEEHLPTSQRAVSEYYELLGMKKNASTPSVTVAFVINRGDASMSERSHMSNPSHEDSEE